MKNYEGIKHLSERYAKEHNISKKEARTLVTNFIGILRESLADPTTDGVQFIDFITLEKVERKPKLARNPRTNVEMIVPKRMGIKVSLGKTFANIFKC